ncbi:MAG: GNAT family N-acetyltransferase, partial [Acidimicrobiia bacterium]|nr:GNAT family N-acetyltransferase [Acidimicrobiia bacterium]
MPDIHDWSFNAVLKDGGVVRIRPIEESDGEHLQEMVRHMGRESLYNRFFRVKSELTEEEVDHFTHLDYSSRMAFVAELHGEVVAVARYDTIPEEPGVAEVAFAVRDAQQGRGLATRMLQHLTAYARQANIERFKALVLAENYAMIRVFRNSGFRLTRDLEEGVYTVEFPTDESDESRAVEEANERHAVAASILPFFYPKTVAVIGASRDPRSIGGRLFANLVNGDFAGPVFPVNPSAGVVRSVKAYPSVADIPDAIDLAFLVVPASRAIQAATECAEKGVRSLVVITAGFSETGDEGAELERELLDLVRSAGMRMIGPNC